ncbi:MAG: ECF transporter S component [Ruminococcaceae bacterium]|nr:ECF transporter S component [Oscillospiraceae bacterium]
MKKSNIAMLIVFLALIPLTLFLGDKLPGKGYYITGILIIIELSVPFFMMFEKRKPQARELVVLAVMIALAVIGRVAIPIPHFKAVFAIIMLTGIAFGPEAGFIVGAITAFASNFFYGQGAYMPWQMMAYGAGGMLAGFVFIGNKKRKPWVMAIFGFLANVLWIGPILDTSHIFIIMPEINLEAFIASLASGFPVNVSQGISTAIMMLVFGKPLLEKLDRVKQKYGMPDHKSGN